MHDVEIISIKKLDMLIKRHNEENLECYVSQGECCIHRENDSLNEYAVELHGEIEMRELNHWCFEVFRSLTES